MDIDEARHECFVAQIDYTRALRMLDLHPYRLNAIALDEDFARLKKFSRAHFE
jgi:hypothetical protein